MEMSGEHIIPANREAVWAALNDAGVLQACIPGCEEVVKSSDTELSAKVRLKIGPVKARFSGDVTLSDIVAPETYVISGKGNGGVAGFAKGGARVHLEDLGDEGTKLTYEVEAAIGGKLAQLGQRLIKSTSEKLAAQFFDSFAAQFEPEAA
ncbi:carbon monoxide dehydrogenase [Rhodobacteraceae bacterium RKSG542]|uniref:CoxG family protein n=1 Tax=Pseudovibrio flavus TaxID=2529854 RepID=UPI0012BC2232|nr:carbon monoxide dehydrogenase subunit G [Pseudovibrio flavus]MTI17735.1 carbon monoxide dehydrogenase [Pseudovibrio flavus]